jgi:hypothetical protein
MDHRASCYKPLTLVSLDTHGTPRLSLMPDRREPAKRVTSRQNLNLADILYVEFCNRFQMDAGNTEAKVAMRFRDAEHFSPPESIKQRSSNDPLQRSSSVQRKWVSVWSVWCNKNKECCEPRFLRIVFVGWFDWACVWLRNIGATHEQALFVLSSLYFYFTPLFHRILWNSIRRQITNQL